MSSSASCNYSTLTTYNNINTGNRPAVPPTSVSGVQVVPVYGGIGYDALTSPIPSCSGYRNILTAYNRSGMNAANCNTSYSSNSCM